MFINIAGMDPALANWGVARMRLNIVTMELRVDSLHLVETEKRTGKVVRQNSDDLRRCQEIIDVYHGLVKDCAVIFSEVPTGAQSARAMFSNGVVTGLLASSPVPIVAVQPFETKLATVGTKTASKEEMVAWGSETYPDAPWLRRGGKILNKNEHLADAVAVVHAGIKTDQFRQLLVMMRAMPGDAAAA